MPPKPPVPGTIAYLQWEIANLQNEINDLKKHDSGDTPGNHSINMAIVRVYRPSITESSAYTIDHPLCNNNRNAMLWINPASHVEAAYNDSLHKWQVKAVGYGYSIGFSVISIDQGKSAPIVIKLPLVEQYQNTLGEEYTVLIFSGDSRELLQTAYPSPIFKIMSKY